jgi:hypothetical protein
MKLTIFKSVQEAYVADVVEGDWKEIAAMLTEHDPAEHKHDVLMYNFAEFKTLADPTAEPARRYHGQVVDGVFVRDPAGTYDTIPNTIRRCKANVLALWGIVLDVDENKTIEQAIEMLDGLEYVLYTTFRHTPEQHKFRIVIPFSRPLRAEDIAGRKDEIIKTFPDVDNASFTVSQSFYFHSGPCDSIAWHNQGIMLDPYEFAYTAPVVYTAPPADLTPMNDDQLAAYKRAVYESLKTCSGLHYAGKGANNGAVLTLVSICKSIDMDFATFDQLCKNISAADSQLQTAAARVAAWSSWQGNKIRREKRDAFIKEWGGKPIHYIESNDKYGFTKYGKKFLKRTIKENDCE